MTAPASPKVKRGTVILSERVWALIEDACKAAGVPMVKVIQGSWSHASASAQTHAGGGAADLSVAGLSLKQRLALVNELRKRNVAAYLRSPQYGWTSTGAHIHMIVADEPGLSAAAQAQVIAYEKGWNGLAGNSRRKDPFARPEQHTFVVRKEPVVAQSVSKDNVLVNLAVRGDAQYPPVTVATGKYVELGRINVPAGSRYEPSAAIRLPEAPWKDGTCWATWKFVRVGWGADPDGMDETGCQPLYARPDGKAVSHTPKGHIMRGGGPLSYQICVFADTPTVDLPTVKLMLNKVEAG